MIGRLREGPSREQALTLGLATEDALNEMIRAWEDWRDTDTATLGLMNGEVIINK